MEFKHTPVLLKESIDNLKIIPSGIYLDCTLGGAGHSSEIVKKLNSNGLLIGFDKDLDAIKSSFSRLNKLSKVYIYNQELKCFNSFFDKDENFDKNNKTFYNLEDLLALKRDVPISILVKSDFKNSPEILKQMGISSLNGVLIDLGVSSYQIDNSSRGFSFRSDSFLDMRMDKSENFTAKDIINNYSEKDLISLFYKYGEEEFSKRIVKNIIKEREIQPIETTKQLNDIVEKSIPAKILFSRGGASKKVFQALRIEVNNELLNLDSFIKKIISFLFPSSRICIISFHSLEDRIVKESFKSLSLKCICPPTFPKCVCNHKPTIKLITKKPITASYEEIENNSRSAPAKLRVAEKIKE